MTKFILQFALVYKCTNVNGIIDSNKGLNTIIHVNSCSIEEYRNLELHGIHANTKKLPRLLPLAMHNI